jgi:Zn-dependent protease
MPEELSLIQKIAIWAIPVIFAITVHEVSHGYVARLFGDDTAARAGRLTLNPVRHVDPVGTLLVPGIMLLLGGFIFGWAKPVPVNAGRMRNPRRHMAVVAAAGPLSNALMAIGWALLLRVSLQQPEGSGIWTGFALMANAGITINLILMVLNLLPVPPLDGGRVLVGLLPQKAALSYARIEPYGLLIVILLYASHMLERLLGPPLILCRELLLSLFGIG